MFRLRLQRYKYNPFAHLYLYIYSTISFLIASSCLLNKIQFPLFRHLVGLLQHCSLCQVYALQEGCLLQQEPQHFHLFHLQKQFALH